MDNTGILSDFVSSLRYEDIPADVIEVTKRYIVDYYAACFAGMRVNAAFNRMIEASLLDMGGKPECDYLLSAVRLPCANAAFMNACYAHGADMDDGNRKAMGHVGAHVLSAVLTLAQTLPVNGRDILTAVVAGYDVYNRVAAAVQPGLVHRGFHSTGTAGAIACGAVCARLMGLSADEIYHAMALCAIQASGLILIAESGQTCKPLNPANAARTGVLSARWAAAGVESPLNPLDSRKGFFHAMSDVTDESQITDGLGSTFTVCESYMKPYPSCRHTHCGIEAALDIRERLPKNANVQNVKVYIYPNAIRIAGQILVPKTDADAKFSIHYALACALANGSFTLDDLDASAVSERVLDLIGRIELIEDETMENRDAGIRGARVVVTTQTGESFEKTVLIPKGDAANPFSDSDLRDKLSACARGVLTPTQQETLLQAVYTLETKDRLTSINLFKE